MQSYAIWLKLEQQNDTAAISKEKLPGIIVLNYDSYLLFTTGFLKYGTQYVFDDITGKMLLALIDTTLAFDLERMPLKRLKQIKLFFRALPGFPGDGCGGPYQRAGCEQHYRLLTAVSDRMPVKPGCS